MANCSDNVYVIKYTDKSKGTITITKSSLVTNLVDIALVGKSRLDYGEVFNENILHLLENFSCPANSGDGDPNAPDTSVAFGNLLSDPVDGQKWYNSTAKRLYVYNKNQEVWVPQSKAGDVAGNSGIISHGEFIPRPSIAGYVFPYSECNFVVSQHSLKSIASDTFLPSDTEIDYMRCYVTADGKVTMQFRYRGESSLRNGYANYQVIGIRGESNTPVITVTPYPVPNPTPGVSATVTPTPTPTPSGTPVATPTPTVSPATTIAPSPTRTVTPTPTVSLTRTTTPTPTPTPSASKQPTPTPTLSSQTAVALSRLGVQAIHPEGYMGTAKASYLTFGDGTGARQSTKNGTSTPFTWLTNGISTNYQIRATNMGSNQTGTIEGTFGTWLGMGTTRQWSALTSDPGTVELELKLEVRLISTGAIVDTVTVFLYASIGTPI